MKEKVNEVLEGACRVAMRVVLIKRVNWTLNVSGFLYYLTLPLLHGASLPSSLPCCDAAHDVLSGDQLGVFALGFWASKTMTQTNLFSFYVVQPWIFCYNNRK